MTGQYLQNTACITMYRANYYSITLISTTFTDCWQHDGPEHTDYTYLNMHRANAGTILAILTKFIVCRQGY